MQGNDGLSSSLGGLARSAGAPGRGRSLPAAVVVPQRLQGCARLLLECVHVTVVPVEPVVSVEPVEPVMSVMPVVSVGDEGSKNSSSEEVSDGKVNDKAVGS